jgi:PAS domain S-box-containing protein
VPYCRRCRAHRRVGFVLAISAKLTDVLEAIQPAVTGVVRSFVGRPGGAVTAARRAVLLADLVRTVRNGRVASGPGCGVIEDLSLDELAALRRDVYDAIEAQGPTIATSEVRLLADWFAGLCGTVSARDQEQREQSLRVSERRFRLGLERSTVATFEFDLEGRITWVHNSRLPELAGVELVGRRINEFMGPDESAALDEGERNALRTGERINMHVSLYHEGERLHRLFGIELLRDDSGEPIGFSGTSVDTTELRRAEAELRRAVAFREQLIGILGHDLRNPVSAVRGLASLLQLDRSLPSKTLEGLARIERVGRRMSEMIGTLLDFTRIRFHAQLPVSPSDMDFGELCQQVIDEVLAAHPGREVLFDASGDLRGRWDYARLAQVVTNLLSNAFAHGDANAPVRLIMQADPRSVMLDVVNQGPTIPPADIPTLFEPFVQGPPDESTARRGGLGLGLYIANQIVASHGGTLTAQSNDGTTRFTIRLHRQREAASTLVLDS